MPMLAAKIFMYLQILDFVTTIAGFKMGLVEGSPMIRWMTQFGPVFAVAASKLLAFTLCAVCYWFNLRKLLRRVNYWYAAVVAWNVSLLIASSRLIWG
jgi:hypothetical protein